MFYSVNLNQVLVLFFVFYKNLSIDLFFPVIFIFDDQTSVQMNSNQLEIIAHFFNNHYLSFLI